VHHTNLAVIESERAKCFPAGLAWTARRDTDSNGDRDTIGNDGKEIDHGGAKYWIGGISEE
jgi:hypothetical protein